MKQDDDPDSPVLHEKISGFEPGAAAVVEGTAPVLVVRNGPAHNQ